MTFTNSDEKYVYKKPGGGDIYCYGSIKWDSNFHVCCDDEDFDGVIVDCEGDKYNTWEKVCVYLLKEYREDIEELTAV